MVQAYRSCRPYQRHRGFQRVPIRIKNNDQSGWLLIDTVGLKHGRNAQSHLSFFISKSLYIDYTTPAIFIKMFPIYSNEAGKKGAIPNLGQQVAKT